MTIVVLLILAMVWVVVLGPSLLRRRAERRSTDSIGAFHRQLRVLERTGPVVVDPVHRLQSGVPFGSGLFRAPGSRGGALVVRPDAYLSGEIERTGVRRPDPYFRPEACKRRRDILLTLLGLLFGTGLLGAIPALNALLYLTMVGGACLAAYVCLLVYLRNLALERQVKLHYLPQPDHSDAAEVARRIAAH